MPDTAAIAVLNDAFRKGERPELGRIVITGGARDLTAAFGPLGPMQLYEKVKAFDDFSEDNDPHKERDFGSFEHDGEKLFWKLDYYAPDMQHGSDDPSDPTKTVRVLTIMLASEY
jgi:hypothetical protein